MIGLPIPIIRSQGVQVQQPFSLVEQAVPVERSLLTRRCRRFPRFEIHLTLIGSGLPDVRLRLAFGHESLPLAEPLPPGGSFGRRIVVCHAAHGTPEAAAPVDLVQ